MAGHRDNRPTIVKGIYRENGANVWRGGDKGEFVVFCRGTADVVVERPHGTAACATSGLKSLGRDSRAKLVLPKGARVLQ